jgi:hypothetical protein
VSRLDRDDVLAHARASVPNVIRALAIKGKESAGQWRTPLCPVRGGVHGRDACAISMESGVWHCHVCNEGGDLVGLVASCYGLDTARDFPAVPDMSRRPILAVRRTRECELARDATTAGRARA